jgi:uncharacterized protein YndB with AHSA1/START domain
MASSITGPETKVEIRRMFAAPREKVFEAWTQREKLEKWMCRFPRNETRYTAFDARPGGTNLMEVTRQKINEQVETLVTVVFQPRGTFTEVFLTHEGFTSAEARADHNKGWNGCFDALEKTLEA